MEMGSKRYRQDHRTRNAAAGELSPRHRLILAVVALGMIVGALIAPTPEANSAKASVVKASSP